LGVLAALVLLVLAAGAALAAQAFKAHLRRGLAA
jgi:hypothetical protein